MASKAGSFSPGATGNVSIAGLSFLPTEVVFRMGPTTGTTDTSVTRRCDGWATAANQSFDSFYEDSTGRQQTAGTTKCISHYARVSGTLTEKVAANFVSFDTNTPTNFGFTINMTAADPSYQIRYIARD